MSIDCVLHIARDILKYAVFPIKHLFSYGISFESYAQKLQTNVGKLEYQADWVHLAMEEAKKNSRHVLYRVRDWQRSAKKASKEARELLGNFEKESKTCRYGTLPYYRSRYQFSKEALCMIERIQILTREGNKCSGLDQISARASFQLGEDAVVDPGEIMILDILDSLANKSNCVVGIYGVGGIGKSYLLGKVESRIRTEKSFDWVIPVDVSRNPDIRKIQGEIAYPFGLTVIEAKQTICGRAELLHRRLEDEKTNGRAVLIILDDLWEGLDLKLVGIPCGPNNKVKGCQLLLASRSRNVLRREMGCDRSISFENLEEEEAEILFVRIVGEKVHNEEFRPLVEAALDKCAGAYALIVEMAARFRVANSSEWKDILKKNVEVDYNYQLLKDLF